MPDSPVPPTPSPPRWLIYCLILGLYLTLRGYHSRDGDQAYRLPLLLHQQNPALFDHDPFVGAFEAFNPHRGSLALLDTLSRLMGLSATLAALWGLTFGLTCLGIDRLARSVWPEMTSRVGVVAIGLLLMARAGNIGTNHLFEPLLLDRLIGFALGWLAFALVIENPEAGWWKASLAIGAAGLVHPSVGLQLGLALGSAWIGWGFLAEASWRIVGRGVASLGIAVAPGLAMNLGQGGNLLVGMPAEEFRLLSVELQGPQHMLPHLWRWPQWLAWGCYPVLALLSLVDRRASNSLAKWPGARIRLAVLLAVVLIGLAGAWVAVELVQDLRVTLFQPFRMATVARGLALVALSGRILALWRRSDLSSRCRAALLTVGLVGDWALVVVTLVEVVMSAFEGWPVPIGFALAESKRRWLAALPGLCVLVWGLRFLSRHDTESGHVPLLAAAGVATVCAMLGRRRSFEWSRGSIAVALILAWLVPAAALLLEVAPLGESVQSQRWALALVAKCRFAEVPTDDLERLGVWCREHTPRVARFIGPPGPKTFRLWSLRSLAFNRASSPYHAKGLADWSARYRDHVGFAGSAEAFGRAYLSDRHALEQGYEKLSDAERASLAIRQGATHVLAAAPVANAVRDSDGPLELLHVEGRHAVYRVRAPVQVADRNRSAR